MQNAVGVLGNQDQFGSLLAGFDSVGSVIIDLHQASKALLPMVNLADDDSDEEIIAIPPEVVAQPVEDPEIEFELTTCQNMCVLRLRLMWGRSLSGRRRNAKLWPKMRELWMVSALVVFHN